MARARRLLIEFLEPRHLKTSTLPGDFNQDGHVTAADMSPMMAALVGLKTYESSNGLTDQQLLTIGDLNQDGQIDGADLQGLINLIANQPPPPAPAVISSTASFGAGSGNVVGSAILTDSAILSGGSNATGSITFTLTAPDGSTSTVGTMSVTGAGTYNAPTASATEVGTYTWQAGYSGDSLNNSAIDNGQNDSLTTIKATAAISSTASFGAGSGNVAGSAILTDSATLTGGYNATGSITFTLTAPDGSTSTVGTVSVTGAGTYTAPTVTATEVGSYVWHAGYSGDSLNNSAIDNGQNDSLTTIKATAAISNTASFQAGSGNVVGSAILTDSAILSGGSNATGSITFTLTAPDGSTSTVGTVSVTGAGTYTAPTVTATEVGSYVWHAGYSGDGLNNSALDNGQNDSLTTIKATAAISSTASFGAGSGNVAGSAILTDSATLTGGYNATGTITFTLTAPDGSTSTVGTVSVTGAGTYTAPTVTATEVGSYVWHAGYSGDSLNNSAVDNGQNDSVTTIKAAAAISNTASFQAGSGNVVGSAILTDSATLTGGYNATGSITFTLTAPDGSTSTVGTVSVTGAGTYTAPTVTATEVGTYVWHAGYSGDGLNNSALDNGQNDSLTTIKAAAVISNTASFQAGSGNVAGSAILTDSAILSGGYHLGGTITFTLTAPDGSTSTVGAVSVTGAGTYNAPTVLATQVGTYVWHVSYSGDGLNNSALDNGQNDSLITIPPVQTWFDTHVQTAAIRTLGDSDYQDGVLSRNDMIGIFGVVEQAGTLTSSEMSDLKAIVNDTALFGGANYVQVLSSDVVLGNTANAHYQGATLGNLAVGFSATQLTELVDKWFLGADHPTGMDDFGNTYTYSQVSGVLFGANGPSYTDVQQGEVGDCYFLAALAEIAIKNPSAITSMFIVNGDGTYTVRFFKGSQAQYVTVDQQLPTTSSGTLIFDGLGASATDPSKVLWAELAEKAYVEINECGWIRSSSLGGGMNVYTDISGGYMYMVLGQVTGQATVSYEATGNSSSFNTLAAAFNAGKEVCLASTAAPSNSQVIGSHAYAVLAVDTSAQTVTLFNPWGINYGLITLTWSDVQANFPYFDQTA